MKGHQKFLGGGNLKSKILEAKYEAKPEFPGGTGVQNKKPNVGGSMDIFGNYIMSQCFFLAPGPQGPFSSLFLPISIRTYPLVF